MPATETTRSPAKLPRSTEDRDAARDGRLDSETDLLLPRQRLQRGALAREKELVRRDDGLAGAERGPNESARRLVAADELDDEIHVLGRRDRDEVRRPAYVAEIRIADLRRPAGADGRQPERGAAAVLEVGPPRDEEPGERASDVPVSQKAHTDRRPIAFHARAMYGTETQRSKARLRRHRC